METPPGGVVVIGGSAGAIEPLIKIVEGLPADFPAAVLVVIHTPPTRENMLGGILGRRALIPAATALHGEPIRAARIHLAPSGHHLLLEDGHLHVTRGPRENGHRPAIDPLFRTAAFAYGPAVVGVVLSGTRDDGSVGLQVIRRHGGTAVVQDPADAIFPDMPQNAIDAAGPQHVVPAASIAQLLTEIVSRPRTGEEVMAPSKGPGVGERPADPIGASDVNGSPTGLSCPECHGVVWASADLDGPPYRCRTGHSFSEEALLDVQVDALENALWAAVRALQENSSLNQALARRAGRRGDQRSAASFSNRSEDAAQQAKLIEGMLVQRAEPAEEQGERD